jgi:DNA-binding MarR family transcriptional regulator
MGPSSEAGGKLITCRDENSETSILGCLNTVGIRRLSDWDVLSFIYRHGVTLTSADQIARLMGYENTAIGNALDRLERDKLIQRSRGPRGVRIYRILDPTSADRKRCLESLLRLSRSREGRLMMIEQLRLVPTDLGRERQSSEVRTSEI